MGEGKRLRVPVGALRRWCGPGIVPDGVPIHDSGKDLVEYLGNRFSAMTNIVL
jgi:hypothetical protein